MGGLVLVSVLVGIVTVASPKIALAMVAGLILVPCTLRFPVGTFYGVIAYAAFAQESFLHWTVVSLGGLNIKPSDIGFALMAIAILHGVLSNRLELPRKSWVLLVLAGLTALSLFAVIRNLPTVGSQAIGEARYYIAQSLILVFLVIYGRKISVLYGVVKTLVLAGCAGVAKDWIIWLGDLSAGPAADRMSTAYNMVPGSICLVLAIALLLSNKPREIFPVFLTQRRWVIRAISILLATTVVFAGHRSVWLGTLTALSVVVLLTRGQKMKHAVSVAVVFVVVAMSLLVAESFSGGRISSTLQGRTAFLYSIDKDATGSWRVGMWKRHTEEAKKNLLIGRGFGKFSWFYDHSSRSWIQNSAHNTYVMWFEKIGLIGLTLYLVFWGGVFGEGIRALARIKDRSTEYLAGAVLAVLAGTMVFNIFYESTVFLWLFGGILLAIAYHRHGSVYNAQRGC